MSNTLKITLTNFFYKIVTRLTRLGQQLLGASTVGVRAIVLNEKKQVLLVKHTYTPGWYFPGGGVEKGETARAAIIRELREETGIVPLSDPQLVGVFFHVCMGVNDYPILYVVNNYSILASNSPEIAEIKWFDYTDLPEDVRPSTRRKLDEYFSGNHLTDIW